MMTEDGDGRRRRQDGALRDRSDQSGRSPDAVDVPVAQRRYCVRVFSPSDLLRALRVLRARICAPHAPSAPGCETMVLGCVPGTRSHPEVITFVWTSVQDLRRVRWTYAHPVACQLGAARWHCSPLPGANPGRSPAPWHCSPLPGARPAMPAVGWPPCQPGTSSASTSPRRAR